MSNSTQLPSEYKNTNAKSRKKKILAVVLAITIVVVSATVGLVYTFSKYSLTLDPDYHNIVAEDFYFSSDYLVPVGETVPTYTIYNRSVNNSITINVMNFLDQYTYTKYDISFSMNVNTAGATLTAANGDTTLSYSQGDPLDEIALTLTASAAGTYAVTVTSTSPYQKSLTANFRFYDYPGPVIEYSIVDSPEYVTINAYVPVHQNDTTTATLAWNNSLISDSTNAMLQNVTTHSSYKSVILNLNTGSSYQFILYKPKANWDQNVVTKASSASATGNTSNSVFLG